MNVGYNLRLVYDYRDHDGRRRSFNELARLTFGIDFEEWYARGLWTGRYCCFSYEAENGIVANVSVSSMDLTIDGQPCSALQIGTVMTRPDYRGLGLSRRLIEHVLAEYAGVGYDRFYLFANRQATDFYPKFGFEPVGQHQYIAPIDTVAPGSSFERTASPARFRRLNPADKTDFRLLQKLVAGRVPVSHVFGSANNPGIELFHCMHQFPDCLYLWERQPVVAICRTEDDGEGGILDLYDLIGGASVDFGALLSDLPALTGPFRSIRFHFTPDLLEVPPSIVPVPLAADNTLFMRSARASADFDSAAPPCAPGSACGIGAFMAPVTSQA